MRKISSKHLLLLAFLLLLIGASLLFSKKGVSPVVSGKKSTTAATQVQALTMVESARTSFDSPTPNSSAAQDPTAKERRAQRSLETMSRLLAKAFAPNATMEQVIQELAATGQKPFTTRTGDPAAGRLTILRTKSPLPGTRYFHAQYFTDEQGKVFPQHMSFEFKPGPRSMQEAVQAATNNFRLGQATEQKSDFIQWNLDDDYVLWIKKKSAIDLEDDPFNAYDPAKDVGTVQMSVEMKIHGDAHEGHEH